MLIMARTAIRFLSFFIRFFFLLFLKDLFQLSCLIDLLGHAEIACRLMIRAFVMLISAEGAGAGGRKRERQV